MKYLVDTNILLRLVQKNSPMHLDTQRAILTLKKQGEFLCIIPQNIIEFWAVATRPLDKNGLGLSINQAEEESEKLKKIFILELDTPQIFTEWESLVIKYHGKISLVQGIGYENKSNYLGRRRCMVWFCTSFTRMSYLG
jgi:predicted nucleic acid-binding protein